MNNKVIEVLDYIGEKLGIAVDWTADNVWPQVIDILGRYRILQLVEECLWLVAIFGLAIIFIKLWKRIYKSYVTCKNDGRHNIWWDYRSYNGLPEMTGCLFGFTMFSVICGVFIAVSIPFIVSAILKWLLVPEMQFLELFSNYLSKVG